LVGVLFPAFATSSVQDRSRTALLFDQGVKYIFVILFPAVLLIVTWANEGLEYWLGAEFAQNSTQVLQLLAVGVLVNSIAQAPFGLVQALGRPDLAAKLHFVELPVYLLALWWLVETLGIEGAAIAWLGRVTVDGLVLFIMVRRFLPDSTIVVRRVRGTYLLVGLAIITLGLAALPMYIAVKALFLTLALPAFVLGTWFFILSPADRTTVRKHVTRGALRNRGQ
jgi:O-antigen/teichoic acid export membrane protein